MRNHFFKILLLLIIAMPLTACFIGYVPFYGEIELPNGDHLYLTRASDDTIWESSPYYLKVSLAEAGDSKIGRTIFESGRVRELVITRPEKNRYLSFLYHGRFSIIPEDIYEIKGREVKRVYDKHLELLGIIQPLTAEAEIGCMYFEVTIIFLLAIISGVWAIRVARRKNEITIALLLGFFSAGMLLLWILSVFPFDERQLLPLLFGLHVIALAIFAAIYALTKIGEKKRETQSL